MKTQQKGLNMMSIGDVAAAELHGTQIACMNKSVSLLALCHGGWPTASTVRAINAFFEAYDVPGKAYRQGNNVYVDIKDACKGFCLSATPVFLDLNQWNNTGMEVSHG